MGIVFIKGTVTGPTGKQETLKFLVDAGVAYTLLPGSVWRRRRVEADGFCQMGSGGRHDGRAEAVGVPHRASPG